MNETMKKFMYPETLIREYKYWVVLLRNEQITLGSLILCTKLNVDSLSKMPEEALTELKQVTSDLEKKLKHTFMYDKINYLALMMIDKEFHWHVIPRYSSTKQFDNVNFKDFGWPAFPDFTLKADIDGNTFNNLLVALKM